MKTIIVDDEMWMLRRFGMECHDIPDLELIGSFQSAKKALEFANDNQIDLAFLDVQMSEENGLDLAEDLRNIYPEMIVIFLSAYEQYMGDAFRRKIADYYVLKPYNREDVEAAVDRARLLSGRLRKSIYIRTFGTFEIFINDRPVQFEDAKAKELLALLVQAQGGVVNAETAGEALYSKSKCTEEDLIAFRKTCYHLLDELNDSKLFGLVEQNSQGVYLHTGNFDCDLYEYQDGDMKTMRQFAGEYMTGYPWGEARKAALARQNELLIRYSNSKIHSSLVATVHCLDDDRLTLTYMNDSFLKMTGYSIDEIEERFGSSLRAMIMREDMKHIKNSPKPENNILQDSEFRILSKKDNEIWVMCKSERIAPTPGSTRIEIECMLVDISGIKAEQYDLQQLAQHDSLTGLLNRGTAQARMEQYISERGKHCISAFVLMDVDNFKAVNDTYGHPFADTVLTNIAAILTRSFRSDDIIGRLGGDEYMFFLKDVKSKEQADTLIHNAAASLAKRMKAKTPDGEITCSFGAALYPDNGVDYLTLYQTADQALYLAKRKRNSIAWYDPTSSNEDSSEQAAEVPEDQLPSAITREIRTRLFESGDLIEGINDIIEELGRQYDVSRVYIFESASERNYFVNTFEWCADGIAPEKLNLQALPSELINSTYLTLFDPDGLFCCYDVRRLPESVCKILDPQGIKSMLQYELWADGKRFGIVGFDECREYRYWNGRQVKMLADFASLLSEALYAYRKIHGNSLEQLRSTEGPKKKVKSKKHKKDKKEKKKEKKKHKK